MSDKPLLQSLIKDIMHKHKCINNKNIYIVESHHQVLLAWSYIRRTLESAPNLITLDHHTDTMPAFNSFRCGGDSYDIAENYAEALAPLIDAIDWNNDDSLLNAIYKLKYDEHIHAATLSGILHCAFAINLWNQTPSIEEEKYTEQISLNWTNLFLKEASKTISHPTPPFTYQVPENRIFEISADCAIGCTKKPHNDDCLIVRADQVLESFYLDHELNQANIMAESIGLSSIETARYILDIDLDYFHSEKAINPDNADTFYRLVNNAEAITIAMERKCVEELKVEGSSITSDSLLKRVLEHIAVATS